jgi:hypothetical protein
MQQIYNGILAAKIFILIFEDNYIGAMTFSFLTLSRMMLNKYKNCSAQQNSENAIILQIVLIWIVLQSVIQLIVILLKGVAPSYLLGVPDSIKDNVAESLTTLSAML